MLEEAGRQLAQRQSLFSKRLLFLFLPPSIIYGTLFFLAKNYINEHTRDTNPELFKIVIIVFPIVAIITILYVAVIYTVFGAEKRIWIDSYFDGKNLSGSQSWRIARRLFWSILTFNFSIWLRFYFIPMILIAAFFVFAWWLLLTSSFVNSNVYLQIILLLSPFLSLFSFPVYYYLIKTKLRFAPFLFLDTYGPTFSYKEYFNTLKELNKASGSDSFKKALFLNLGTDVVNSVFEVTIDAMISSLPKAGKIGEAVEQTGRAFAGESIQQVTDFGKMAGFYLLYKIARKQLYGEEQRINEYLYKLVA